MAATAEATFTATLSNVKVLFTPSSSERKQNGYRGFHTSLDHPFSRLQSCVTVHDRRIRCRRLSYDVLHQRCLPRSHVSLSRMLSWSLLVLPPFQDVIRSLWAAPREQGFWEKNVCLLWRNMGKIYPDWEQNCYLQHFRMSKDTFWYLCQTYGKYFEKTTTQLRLVLSDSAFFTITIVAKAIFTTFDSITIVHFSLINEI